MNPAPINSVPPCALCGARGKLEQSHIIPQFVYRWAKTRAGQHDIPPGPTRPMLCGACEDEFSFYESEFARHVFHPLAAGTRPSTKYGAWLRQFAASVCWRIIEESLVEARLGSFQGRWTAELAACRETWHHYLSGQRPDVGGHHLHLLPWAALASGADAGLQPRIESEVSGSDHAAFVYARLGPVILLGLIADPDPKPWRGTRINAEGKLKPRDVAVPDRYRDYLLSRTRLTAGSA